MFRKVALVALAVCALGCGNRTEMPLYGNWEGRFEPDRATDLDMKGYLQLYATNHKFKMHVGGRNQTFDPTGVWRLQGRQIVLDIQDMQISGLTAQEAEERKALYIDPKVVRGAFGKSLVLNLSADQTQLRGITLTIGSTQGHFSFS